MTSHALLLRLFLSPKFFSIHVALKYLLVYSDNIGITYYLTRRLSERDVEELYDVWGFICHLAVTRPSKSRALEVFVVDTAQRSTHIAMITLWFMQSSLHDLVPTTPHSQSFPICHRILHKCHQIIFNHVPRPPTASPYPSFKLSAHSPLSRKKVRYHPEPAFVGMGVILASAPAMPALAEITGQIAIEQGRADDDGRELRSLQTIDPDVAPDLVTEQPEFEDPDEVDSPQVEENSEDSLAHDQDQGANLSRRRTIPAAQTVPALPLHLRSLSIRRSRASEDPLGQLDAELPSTTSHQSSPSLPAHNKPLPATTTNTPDVLLEKYDSLAQTQLLRGHYCHSEIQFILDLENICSRLLIVPKPARVSALRAELTALNHKLPAEVCMPMWCNSSDTPRGPNHIPQPHHRVVRIPPGESVVLNSAERAPYLLLIEVLHDELDFDPTKRVNRDILKKIVAKENEQQGASKDLVPFGRGAKSKNLPSSSQQQRGTEEIEVISNPTGLPGTHPLIIHTPASEPSTATLEGAFPPQSQEVDNPDEEVDLVEQLYGPEQSLRSGNLALAESIVLPPPLKNKDLDMAAWSASSPVGIPLDGKVPGTGIQLIGSRSQSQGNNQPPPPPSSSIPILDTPSGINNGNGGHTILSLDDYSQRMRTAAIMLAQLNANLVRDQVTPIPHSAPLPSSAVLETAPSSSITTSSSTSRASGWIPSTSWLVGYYHDAPTASASKTTTPTIAGRDHHPHPSSFGFYQTSSTQSRMRLQHAEAQQIRDRIMQEMLALEEARMERMKENRNSSGETGTGLGIRGVDVGTSGENSVEDEGIIKRELNKADPSAVVFSEGWAAKKSRIKSASPYGHLANWDCVSVIVKTGGDLRQEQLAVQLIREFQRIWTEESCPCWVRYFRILILGATSGLVETITDAVSIHSIKKAEYAKRLARGKLGHVTLLDHFTTTYGDPSSAKFARAQRNFAKSLAGYSIITFLLQIKDRHNGNILLDRDGHLIHIDFGFMLSNTPGNIGFEAAPFKLPPEYVEVLGGINGAPFLEFRRLFREGFELARKHCDRIITLVELMQKDSALPCFALYGEQTAQHLRDRFQPTLTHSLVGEYIDRLIDTSLGSNWTRLYDSYQYYSQSIL